MIQNQQLCEDSDSVARQYFSLGFPLASQFSTQTLHFELFCQSNLDGKLSFCQMQIFLIVASLTNEL